MMKKSFFYSYAYNFQVNLPNSSNGFCQHVSDLQEARLSLGMAKQIVFVLKMTLTLSLWDSAKPKIGKISKLQTREN